MELGCSIYIWEMKIQTRLFEEWKFVGCVICPIVQAIQPEGYTYTASRLGSVRGLVVLDGMVWFAKLVPALFMLVCCSFFFESD